jgi:hypothetical protein
MNRDQERNWQKDPNCITEKFEKYDNCPEEDIIPFVEKEIAGGYSDNRDESNYFFNIGGFISFLFCLTFWAIILYFQLTV